MSSNEFGLDRPAEAIQNQGGGAASRSELRQQVAERAGVNPQRDVRITEEDGQLRARLTADARERLAVEDLEEAVEEETDVDLDPDEDITTVREDGEVRAKLTDEADDLVSDDTLQDIREEAESDVLLAPEFADEADLVAGQITRALDSEDTVGILSDVIEAEEGVDWPDFVDSGFDPTFFIRNVDKETLEEVGDGDFRVAGIQTNVFDQAGEQVARSERLIDDDPSKFLDEIEGQDIPNTTELARAEFEQMRERSQEKNRVEDRIAGRVADERENLSAEDVAVDVTREDILSGDVDPEIGLTQDAQQRIQQARQEQRRQAIAERRETVREDAREQAAEEFSAELPGQFAPDDVTLQEQDGQLVPALDEQARETAEQRQRDEFLGQVEQQLEESVGGRVDLEPGEDITLQETDDGLRPELSESAVDELAAESRPQLSGVVLSPEFIEGGRRTEGGIVPQINEEGREFLQRDIAAANLSERLDTDVEREDVVVDDGEVSLADDVRRERAAAQLDEELAADVTPGDVLVEDGQVRPTDETIAESVAAESDLDPGQVAVEGGSVDEIDTRRRAAAAQLDEQLPDEDIGVEDVTIDSETRKAVVSGAAIDGVGEQLPVDEAAARVQVAEEAAESLDENLEEVTIAAPGEEQSLAEIAAERGLDIEDLQRRVVRDEPLPGQDFVIDPAEDVQVEQTDDGLQAQLSDEFLAETVSEQFDRTTVGNLERGEDFTVEVDDGEVQAELTDDGQQTAGERDVESFVPDSGERLEINREFDRETVSPNVLDRSALSDTLPERLTRGLVDSLEREGEKIAESPVGDVADVVGDIAFSKPGQAVTIGATAVAPGVPPVSSTAARGAIVGGVALGGAALAEEGDVLENVEDFDQSELDVPEEEPITQSELGVGSDIGGPEAFESELDVPEDQSVVGGSELGLSEDELREAEVVRGPNEVQITDDGRVELTAEAEQIAVTRDELEDEEQLNRSEEDGIVVINVPERGEDILDEQEVPEVSDREVDFEPRFEESQNTVEEPAERVRTFGEETAESAELAESATEPQVTPENAFEVAQPTTQPQRDPFAAARSNDLQQLRQQAQQQAVLNSQERSRELTRQRQDLRAEAQQLEIQQPDVLQQPLTNLRVAQNSDVSQQQRFEPRQMVETTTTATQPQVQSQAVEQRLAQSQANLQKQLTQQQPQLQQPAFENQFADQQGRSRRRRAPRLPLPEFPTGEQRGEQPETAGFDEEFTNPIARLGERDDEGDLPWL